MNFKSKSTILLTVFLYFNFPSMGQVYVFPDNAGLTTLLDYKGEHISPHLFAIKHGGREITKHFCPEQSEYLVFRYLSLTYYFALLPTQYPSTQVQRLSDKIKQYPLLKDAYEHGVLQVYTTNFPENRCFDLSEFNFSLSEQKERQANLGLGCEVNQEKYERTLSTVIYDLEVYQNLPSRYSHKAYYPIPGDQGDYRSCVGWATAYNALTAVQAMTNNWHVPSFNTKEAYSGMFVYNQIKAEDDGACSTGSFMTDALDLMTVDYVPKQRDYPDVCEGVSSKNTGNTKLFSYRKLEANEIPSIYLVKKALTDKHPVVISMRITNSFYHTKEVYSGIEDGIRGNHAMAIIGYDDEKYGGAVEVINSWGTIKWGNAGFAWIRYEDLEKFTREYYELLPHDYEEDEEYRKVGVNFLAKNSLGQNLSTELKFDANYSYPIYQVKASASSLTLELSLTKPNLFVYVFNDEELIFPSDNSSPYVTSTSTLSIRNFTINGKYLTVLLCRKPLEEELLSRVSNERQLTPEVIVSNLYQRLKVPDNIRYSNQSITSVLQTPEIIPIFIQREMPIKLPFFKKNINK